MGGQTALNCALDLDKHGVLKKYKVELIGASKEAIDKAEDRDLFNKVCESINLPISEAIACNTMDQVIKAAEEIGSWPILIRPAFTLGGLGGGTAFDLGQLVEIATLGLRNSRISQVLIEESILGWQELEYEVMRDGSDNATIVCTMENIDPMGVHTGESVVVAPLQSFSDSDHQELRDKALALIRELNIKGGCNVQFAYNQSTGEIRVIEVNPRVSRSSALASKATGYPIARMAAKIAVGYTLDELPNPITGEGTTAAFEPTLDYVVVKIPRWPFDKFRTADRTLGTSMKSTGEVMGFDEDFGMAFAKSQIAASNSLPSKGLAFISLKNSHKKEGINLDVDFLKKMSVEMTAESKALEQKMARGAGDTSQVDNEVALKSLCIRAEILCDRSTPETDKALRMQFQMSRLQQGFGQNVSDKQVELDAMVYEWLAVGPVATTVYQPLVDRFLKCR